MKLPEQLIRLMVIIALLLIAGCAAGANQATTVLDQEEENVFKMTSDSFVPGEEIPDRFTYKLGSQCSGENYSPELSWEGAPQGTQTYVLTMIDPDGGNWVHWLLLNIPADTTSLYEVKGGPAVGLAGRNSFGENAYGGPCPPSGTHHYVFTLYALDTKLEVLPGITYQAARELLEDHILARCELTGLRSRK